MANQTQILNVSDEMKLNDNVQTKNVKEQEENMYSSSSDTTEELCSSSTTDTYRMRNRNAKERYVEILNFQHFTNYVTFTKDGDDFRNKELRNKIEVSVVLDMECVDMLMYD